MLSDEWNYFYQDSIQAAWASGSAGAQCMCIFCLHCSSMQCVLLFVLIELHSAFGLA